MAFPSFTKAQNYRGGFDKFVYNKLKELSLGNFDVTINTTDGINALASVKVTLSNAYHTFTATSGSKGGCSINDVPAGTYTLSATKTGYIYTSTSVEVSENQDVTVALNQLFKISGTVTETIEEVATPVSGVVVATGSKTVTTGADGTYEITGLVADTYSVTYTKEGYTTGTESVTISNSNVTKNVTLVVSS